MARNRVRLWFWLHVMDAAAEAKRGCHAVYLWAVGKASDNEDWGPELDAASFEDGPL